jgi:hypothetical protein
MTTAAIGGLIVLLGDVEAQAQPASVARPAGQIATFAPGVITGLVRDEAGTPLAGVVVSALGTSTTIALTGEDGRFELGSLPPGPYVVRVHRKGYLTPSPQRVHVAPNGRITSVFSLLAAGSPVILAAGLGVPDTQTVQTVPEPESRRAEPEAEDGELAWRLRYLRRGVLRETDTGFLMAASEPGDAHSAPIDMLSRAVTTPARAATDFFADTDFRGQVNLLTSVSFASRPHELLLSDGLSNGVADVVVGAPVGAAGTWEVRGSLTQSDLSAWMVAASYASHAPDGHTQSAGLSFSAQRYDGRSPMAPPDPIGGSRNVGSVYVYDSIAVSPAVWVTYGGRYARYDYLADADLLSPRLEVNAAVADDLRVRGVASLRAHAPGAEEFLPPTDTGIWLPPQRTFSALDPASGLRAERGLHTALAIEHDVDQATIGIRAFHERVTDQLVTVFGSEMPGAPAAKLGHYFVGSAGEASAVGCALEVRSALSAYARAAVAYTYARARLDAPADAPSLIFVTPSAVRAGAENLHDVSARLEADVPETATRLIVLFRIGNGYAQPASASRPDATRPDLDSRFDVQLRQTLPFMNFTRARLEMLLAVRNFFREAGTEQSLYDELLAVQPPKRIVGGVTLHF